MQLMLSEAISLCENNTSIGQSAPENEGLWFALLDTFGEQQKAMETKLPRASSSRNLEISRTQSSQSTDVAGMAHRRCAIPKPDASADVVCGHDVCETREKCN